MQYQGDSGSKKCRSGATWDLLRKFRRKISGDGGEIHAAFFEKISIFQDASSTATAAFAAPQVFTKRNSIRILETRADAVLQALEVVFCAFTPRHV